MLFEIFHFIAEFADLLFRIDAAAILVAACPADKEAEAGSQQHI